MNKSTWKTLAIIFFITTISAIAVIWYSVYLYDLETEQTNECFYNICADYPDAEYLDNVCYCYDYDFYGDPILEYTEYMQ